MWLLSKLSWIDFYRWQELDIWVWDGNFGSGFGGRTGD